MKKTTFLYIFREIFHIFLIGLLVFTIVLLMDKILKLIELIVSRGASIVLILKLLLYISPSFLVFTIPMAVLVATLLGFGRLSSDNEVTAFKASGISLYQLYVPVGVFSLAAYLVSVFLVFYGLPWGNRGFKEVLFQMAQSNANIEIKERVFNDAFDGLVVYVDKVPIQGEKLEGILIYDEREKGKYNTIFAREGFVANNPKTQEVMLKLVKGDIHRFEPKNNLYQKVQFESYDLKLELAKAFKAISRKLKDREMSIEEIKAKIAMMKQRRQDTTSEEMELQKRYAIPFACLIFGLIGVPLGIQPRRSGRSNGFVFSILIILAYYISLTAAEIFVAHRTLSPLLAGWIPNFLFGGLGIYLLIKAGRESPFRPLVWLNTAVDFIQEKWKGLFEDV
ncbi:MAG: LPS export ABC transporter permease LptF [Deltaproteobacteria bacterium RBG_13_52_11b]|nr:MAG: LPS export ABC transporter permease LptF [Deltaproteobacteria bacterium RBG_13_52_11b]